MHDSIKASLAAILETKPRGPTPGNYVSYNTPKGEGRVLRVVATQQWCVGDRSTEIGLVWAGRCDTCDEMFWQVSAIRKIDLHTECDACDVVGGRGDRIEIAAANAFIGRMSPKGRERPNTKGVKRTGRVEKHVLETVKTFGGVDTIPLPELIRKAIETLPAPDPEERDSRRQRVVRAIHQLAKEADGPLTVKGNLVILFE